MLKKKSTKSKAITAKSIVKRTLSKKHNEETTDYNLVVYSNSSGSFTSTLIERHVTPTTVASIDKILTVKPIQIFKLTPSEGKYKRIKCKDELGDEYDSMLELIVCKEFEAYREAGFISNIERQKPFSFKRIDPQLKRLYYSDITFDCNKTFKLITTAKRPLLFEEGKTYVCDVKSPLTRKDSTFALKKVLMRVGYGIDVVMIVRSYNKAKKTNRVSKKK